MEVIWDIFKKRRFENVNLVVHASVKETYLARIEQMKCIFEIYIEMIDYIL